MTDEEYEKFFHHINDLFERYAMGKIPHQTMYDGFRKLLEEVTGSAPVQPVMTVKRPAFWRGFVLGVVFLSALLVPAYTLWQKGLLSAWIRDLGRLVNLPEANGHEGDRIQAKELKASYHSKVSSH